jgi:hypothetical protein
MPLNTRNLNKGQCINLIIFLKDKALENAKIDSSTVERHMGFSIEIDTSGRCVYFDSGSKQLLGAIRTYLVEIGHYDEADFEIMESDELPINGVKKEDATASLVIDFDKLEAIWDKMAYKGLRDVSLRADEIDKEERGFEQVATLDESTNQGQCLQLIAYLQSKLPEDVPDGERYQSHLGFNVDLSADDIVFQSDSAKLLSDIYQYLMDNKLLTEGECELQHHISDDADMDEPGVLTIRRECFPKLWDSLDMTEVNLDSSQCLQLINFIESRVKQSSDFSSSSYETHLGFAIEMDESTVTFQSGSASLLENILEYLEANDLIYKGKYHITSLPSQTKAIPIGSIAIERKDLPALWQQLSKMGLSDVSMEHDVAKEAERFAASRERFGDMQSLFQSQIAAEQRRTQQMIGRLKDEIDSYDASCQSPDDTDVLHFDDERFTYESGFESIIHGSDQQNYKSEWAVSAALRFHGKKQPPLDDYEKVRYAQEGLLLDYYCTQYVLKNGDSGKDKKQISDELIQSPQFNIIRKNPILCALAIHYLHLKREMEKQKSSQSQTGEKLSADEINKRRLFKKLRGNVGQMCWDLIKTIDEAQSSDDHLVKKQEQLTEIYKRYKTLEANDYRFLSDESLQAKPG